MKRWALIEGTTVANVVEQEDQPQIGGTWVDITGLHVGPGYLYKNGTFLPSSEPPPLPNIITKIAMLTKRLTIEEFSGILIASKTDPQIEAWKYIFDTTTVVDLDSQNTKNGIALLVSKGLLTQQRAEEILNLPVQPEERP